MRRTVRWLACAVLLASLAPVPASALDAAPYSSVVIVLAPYLSWDDLTDGDAPTLAVLAERSAVANVSVRNGSAVPAPDGRFGAAVLSALRPLSAAEAATIEPGAPFGALAGAVRDLGGTTVAIGAGASSALLVAADARGRADLDMTGPGLVRDDPLDPTGVTVDLEAVEAAYQRATASRRPLLVVVDPGQTERARAASDGESWEELRRTSVRTTDEAVARIVRGLPDDAALIVVATAAYDPRTSAGFGPMLLYAGGPGVLASSATRRDGIVTLADVGVTALDVLGAGRPGGAAGVRLAVVDAERSAASRIAAMRALDVRARALEAIREPVWFGFIGACVVVVLTAIAVLYGAAPAGGGAVRRIARWALVALLAIPPGSLLALVGGAPATVAEAWTGLAAGTVAVLALVLAWPRRDPEHALGRLVFITLGILLADQLTGGHLSDGTAFSYSTLFGARFYGLGNEGAAVAFGALLVGIGWRIDHYGANRARGFLISGALAAAVAVLPFLGANIGVAAWGTAAIVGGYLWASGQRLTWRVALGAAAAVAVVIGAAALADALGAGSHLGGLVRALDEGGAGVTAMLARKLEISVRTARATPFVVLLPLGIGTMAYLVARPVGRMGAVLSAKRGLASTWVAVVAGALVAVFTEDSAIAIGAVLMLYALVFAGVVALGAPHIDRAAVSEESA